MELYVSAEIAEGIIEISKYFHVDAQIIGYVKDSNKTKLTIKSEYGEFRY